MTQQFRDTLIKIAIYLIEDRRNAEFVIDCFIQQETLDLEEMMRSEGMVAMREKYETRMCAKKEQVQSLLPHLHYFKNEAFKLKVAEFLQWALLQLDPPDLYDKPFPRELKVYLSRLKRYGGDLNSMGRDVNSRFKYHSPTSVLPSS